MNMPGVSLIAVASPMPTPANRLPRCVNRNSRSAATRKTRYMLTWPNRNVSRSGSNAIAPSAARGRSRTSGPALPAGDRVDQPVAAP